MDNQAVCYNRSCTYNSGYRGYGPAKCSGDTHKYSYCYSRQLEPPDQTNEDLDKLYKQLEDCKYNALAIRDENTETVIREMCDIVKDMIEIIKEKKDE